MTARFLKVATAFVLALCVVIPALGQVTNTHLTGNITDPSGGVLPGATITITNVNTGLVQKTTSNASGEYQLLSVPPGTYTMRVEAKGFKTHVQNGIVLRVSQPATLNVTLTVGSAATTVTVTAGASQLNTVSPQIGQTITHNQIVSLPLNGRDPASLAFLAPGTVNQYFSQASTPDGFSTDTSASSGGTRQGGDWYLLDGVSNNYLKPLVGFPFPNADATEAFRSIVNMSDVRFGFAPAGEVSIQTASGTNQFHGGGFEFIRNSAVNATNYFSGNVDTLRRNQFGFFVGGPILRDKLFFFTNLQWTQDFNAAGTDTAFVPTEAMLHGDFSAMPSEDLQGPLASQVFHTVNGKPNQVNPALFSKAALAIEALMPKGQNAATGFVTFPGEPARNSYFENVSRIDYNITSSQRIFARSYLQNYTQPSATPTDNILAGQGGNWMTYLSLAAGHTWTPSATLVNSVTVSWQEFNRDSNAHALLPDGSDLCMSKIIPSVVDPPSGCYWGGIGAFDGNSLYGGGVGFNTFGGGAGVENSRYWEVTDTFTKVFGNHTIEAGFDFLHRYIFNEGLSLPGGSFNGQYTGNPLADWLLGYMTGWNQGSGSAGAASGVMQAYYAQDTYKVKPNLTLIAGVRWEPQSPMIPKAGQLSTFFPGQQSTRFPNAPRGFVFPGDKGVPRGGYFNTYGYWMPRIGIAWQPKSDWSIRTGFGMYTQPIEDQMWVSQIGITPFQTNAGVSGTLTQPIEFDNPWATYAPTGGKSPFPPFASPTQAPPADSVFLPPTGNDAWQPNFKIALTPTWNFSVDRQIGQNLEVHVGYVGSASYHMATQVDINPGSLATGGLPFKYPYPMYGHIKQLQDGGTGKYNALQASINERMFRGLNVTANFTKSYTTDVGGSGDFSYESSVSDPYDIHHDYGPSSLNYPYIFTLAFVYEFPALRTGPWGLKALTNGWVFSGIDTNESGSPFTMNGGQGNNNSGFGIGQDRADLVPGQKIEIRQGGKRHWLNHYFNPKAFTNNAPGTPGDSPKFAYQGPPICDIDLAMLKNIKVVERYTIQLRVEAYNAFNQPSFSQPDSNPGDSNFGQISSTGSIPARVMQGGIKFLF